MTDQLGAKYLRKGIPFRLGAYVVAFWDVKDATEKRLALEAELVAQASRWQEDHSGQRIEVVMLDVVGDLKGVVP